MSRLCVRTFFFHPALYFHLMNSFTLIVVWFNDVTLRSHWMNWLDATQWNVCTLIQIDEQSNERTNAHSARKSEKTKYRALLSSIHTMTCKSDWLLRLCALFFMARNPNMCVQSKILRHIPLSRSMRRRVCIRLCIIYFIFDFDENRKSNLVV